MKINDVLKIYRETETINILADVLGKPEEFLYLHPEYVLTKKQEVIFIKNIQRLQKGEPPAYILGYKYFYGLKMKVNKHVLIPRPETEQLVDLALHEIESLKATKIKYLDVATGSACIPIAMALSVKKRNNIEIEVGDISLAALRVAQENAKKHQVRINFTHSDLFGGIKEKFHLITANLPYVPKSRLANLSPILFYEPKKALTDGSDTWQIYKRFFRELKKHLLPKGVCIMEIDEESEDILRKYLTESGNWKEPEFIKDLGGFVRFLIMRN